MCIRDSGNAVDLVKRRMDRNRLVSQLPQQLEGLIGVASRFVAGAEDCDRLGGCGHGVLGANWDRDFSRDHIVNNVAFNISQTHVAAAEAEGAAGVIDAH